MVWFIIFLNIAIVFFVRNFEMKIREKIRVCHLVPSLGVGGMENGIVNLANHHAREKFELVICCLNEPGEMAQRLKSDVQLHVLNEKEGFSFLRVFKVAKFLRKFKPNIVHTHAWGGGSLYGILGAKLARVPVVINGEHGAFFLKRHQVVLQKGLFSRCDYYLSVSESLRTKAVQALGLPYEKITVIKNGVDTSFFTGQYSKLEIIEELRNGGFKIEEDSFIVVSIGSLKPEKAQRVLLEAVKRINQEKLSKNKPIQILLVGDGPDREILRDYVKTNNLENSVSFLGSRSDVQKVLSVSDLLVSTSISKHEGLSNVMLEAMSSGVPVIATESVGSQEIVQEGLNGFLINEGDVGRLTECIVELLSDEEKLRRFSQGAKEKILKEFSLPKMVANYEKLYFEAMGFR